MFTTFSLLVKNLFMTSSCLVHNYFIIYSQSVHDLILTCSQLIHKVSQFVQVLFTFFTTFFHYFFMFSTCSFEHYFFKTWSLQSYGLTKNKRKLNQLADPSLAQLSPSLSHLLSLRFWPNFKGRFLGTYRTDSNC